MKFIASFLAIASLTGAFALPSAAFAQVNPNPVATTLDADGNGHIDLIFTSMNPAFMMVNAATVAADDFTVVCNGTQTYAVTLGAVNGMGYNLVLAEQDAFDTASTCTVTYGVSGVILDTFGTPVTGTDVITDGAAPALIASYPANGGTLTDLNANLTLTFSEAIASNSVNASTVYLVEGTSSLDNGANSAIITIDPDAALTVNTAYHLGTSFGLKDLAGNFVSGITTSFLTTAPSHSGGYIAPHLPEGTTPDATGSSTEDTDFLAPGEEAPSAEVLGDTDTDLSTPDHNGIKAGDYIRGTSFSTVYYVGADMNRHPFIDEQTYFTYQDSWDGVIVLADAALADYPMGSLMLPKAGTVLVKIESMNQVYALDTAANGSTMLRLIPNEMTAEYVFGAHWADYVIDIAPTFFTKFGMGDEIDAAFPVVMADMQTRVSLNSK
jgi:hypothetical protein